MATFHPIFPGGVFTFEVGTDKTPFVIHKKVVEDVSSVLTALMDNGMQGSVAGVAQLAHIDATTFAFFAEFAYTGNYKTRVIGTTPSKCPQWVDFYCYDCRDRRVVIGPVQDVPKLCLGCQGEHIIIGDTTKQTILFDFKMTGSRDLRTPESKHEGTFSQPRPRSDIVDTIETFFQYRQYEALDMNHTKLVHHLNEIEPYDPVNRNVMAHLKPYCFSQMYMITSLKQLSLHKLHRDLVHFKITGNNINEVIELLMYAYDHTTDTENEVETNRLSAENEMEHDLEYETDDVVNTISDIEGIDNESDLAGDTHDDTEDESSGSESAEAMHLVEADAQDYKVSIDNHCTHEAAKLPTKILRRCQYFANLEIAGERKDHRELRGLVMTFAIGQAQELVEYLDFNRMLQMGGLADDFTKGVDFCLPFE